MEQGIELHISEVLKEERTKKGNSQEKLAEYCGVSKSAVSKWEQGISRPSIYQFPQIADFYNSNFAHRFCLCTLKIQYLAVIQLSKVCCYAA